MAYLQNNLQGWTDYISCQRELTKV